METITSDYTETDLRTNYNVHDHLKHLSVPELQEVTAADRLPYGVCTVNVNGDLNVGIIIRSAILSGAERVIVYGRTKYNRKSCVGAYHYLPISHIGGYDFPTETFDPIPFWCAMYKFGYHPIFIEIGDGAAPFDHNLDYIAFCQQYYKRKPCFVFGAEGTGIPKVLLDNAIEIFYLKQRGPIRSFNVSATASIVMYSVAQNYKG
jgi:tRNA G18 (ribose-2'-O)-methylase SpoU